MSWGVEFRAGGAPGTRAGPTASAPQGRALDRPQSAGLALADRERVAGW